MVRKIKFESSNGRYFLVDENGFSLLGVRSKLFNSYMRLLRKESCLPVARRGLVEEFCPGYFQRNLNQSR